MFSGLILFLLVTVIQIFSFELKFIIFYQDLNWAIHVNYIEIFFFINALSIILQVHNR